jgi:hypothetical protein
VARHSFDLFSFVAGVLFGGLAIAYTVGAYSDVWLDPRYLLPIGLVVLGAAGVAASVLGQRRSTRALTDAED